MRRSTIRFATCWLAICATSAALAGCASSPLSKGDYEGAVNELLAETNDDLAKAAGKAGSSGDGDDLAVAYYRELSKQVAQLSEDLEQLTAPENVADDHERLAGGFAALADSYEDVATVGSDEDASDDEKGKAIEDAFDSKGARDIVKARDAFEKAGYDLEFGPLELAFDRGRLEEDIDKTLDDVAESLGG